MNHTKQLRYAGWAHLILVSVVLSGCTASKATLQNEVNHVTELLNSWKGKSVEQFLQVNPKAGQPLNLGGGKVRYTYKYDPPNRSEFYVFYARVRYYLLYFYVSADGIIYHTDYERAYRESYY